MRAEAADRVRQLDGLVLDVGGWAVPFGRADWVIDLMPYETRGEWGRIDAEERFSADTWVQRDICDRQPWPFADDEFEFAVCSHTLEDVRDPLWVCSELARVAKAGYIEVPSRLEEQCWAVQGEWAGWSHHHWLIDIDRDAQAIDFLFKAHVVHDRRHNFAAGFHATLTPEQRVDWMWWEGGFSVRERMLFGHGELDADLREFVLANGPPGDAVKPAKGLRARLGL